MLISVVFIKAVDESVWQIFVGCYKTSVDTFTDPFSIASDELLIKE